MSAVEAVWFGCGVLTGVIATTIAVLLYCAANLEGRIDAEKGQ